MAVGLVIAAAASYFSLGRTVETNRNPSFKNQPETPQAKDGSALRKLDVSPTADMDQDGLPDAAELSTFMDRQNFRHWFTGIAEMQFYRLNDHWNLNQRDCAGLVRFAWREAMKHHDRFWYQKMGPGYEDLGADVADHESPLGEKIFRTAYGPYRESDLAVGKFSEFADARTLKTFNCEFISRNRDRAEPGDLLFFYQPWVQKFPFHVMIFIGQARIASDGNNDWILYHTGSSPTDEGTVKKVRLAVLDQHPDKRWRPIETNRNFLGFYRLKILE
ncbi:MAG TPA: DUF1175 family protein [Pyrinomonadaceae bacterium]